MILLTSLSYSQKCSLSEIIKMNKMNWDEFDTYANKKGYFFSKIYEHEDSYEKSYLFGNHNTIGYYVLSKTDINISENQKQILVGFKTSKKEDYLSIKNQINELGFKYTSTGTVTDDAYDGVYLEYQKGDYKLKLYTLTTHVENFRTLFEINILRYEYK